MSSEQEINPFEIHAGSTGIIDYDRIISDFGSSRIDTDLLNRFSVLTKTPLEQIHPFLRRKIFFSHRDLNEILDLYEQGKPFFLYTGRGPSSNSLHLGHLVPFMFAKYLQDVFNVPLVIQLTDDEKYLWKNLTMEQIESLTIENAKDIIACGFDITKTFIFSDFQYVGSMYKNIVKIQRCITYNTAKSVFGFVDSDSCGKIAFPAVQIAPAFASSFSSEVFRNKKDIKCLIPCAIDQDPYFRLSRDVAPRIGCSKPSLIHSKFLPSLKGLGTKMSASDKSSAIYVSDKPAEIEKKVRSAFSGGKETIENQRLFGANIETDVAIQYLNFFMTDDIELENINTKYKSGEMLSGEVKQKLIDILIPLTQDYQKNRRLITDEIVKTFMTPRTILSI
jgi:tryptophanyl-tRNA synthetase